MVVKLSFGRTIELTVVRYALSFQEFLLYSPIRRGKLTNLEVGLMLNECGGFYLKGGYLDGNYNSGWIFALP